MLKKGEEAKKTTVGAIIRQKGQKHGQALVAVPGKGKGGRLVLRWYHRQGKGKSRIRGMNHGGRKERRAIASRGGDRLRS